MFTTQCPWSNSTSSRFFRTGLRVLLALAAISLTTVFVALGASVPAMLYVNDNTYGGANQIDGFYVNPDGTLQPVPGSPFATGGSGGLVINSIAVRPESLFSLPYLYATNGDSSNVSAFKINSNGSLTPVPGSPFADSSGLPLGAAVSADGRFLFVGVFIGIDVFRINYNGSLTLLPGSPFGIDNSDGLDVLFDASRSNVISDDGGEEIGVLHFNSGGGTLTPIPGSAFTTSTGNNFKMALRPQGDLLFVAGGNSDEVDVLKVGSNGSLSEFPGSQVNVSDDVIGTAVHPSGGYVYFGAGSSANVYGYVVDGRGHLTPVPGSPFASGGEAPTGLTTDYAGRFLFAVNTFSDNVTSFVIQGNGALAPIGTVSLKGTGYPSGIAYYAPLF